MVVPHDKTTANRHGLALMYSMRLHITTLPSWHWFVCWAASVRWSCWLRGSLRSWEDVLHISGQNAPASIRFPLRSGILEEQSGMSRPMSRCHWIQVSSDSWGNVWFDLVVFVLEVYFLWRCDVNDGIKVLKLCCAKNKLKETMYTSVLTSIWANGRQ